MSGSNNNKRYSRPWSKKEESLLYDIWESNLKNMESAPMKDVHVSMQKEISLHFDISLKDMVRKMYNVRRQYKKALLSPQYQEQWESFNRIHSFLKVYKTGTKHDKSSPYTVQNGNSTDESIFTIDDSNDYVGYDAADLNIDCEPDIDVFQPEMITTEFKDDIIELDDDNDEVAEGENCQNLNYDCSTDSSAFQPIENQQNMISPALLEPTNTTLNNLMLDNSDKQFAPIQSVQTIEAGEGAANIVPALNSFQNYPTLLEQALSTTAVDTNFSPRVYLCQPVQPQPTIPVAVANPNCESLLNLLQAPTIKSANHETDKQKLTKPAKIQKKETIVDNSAVMLQTLSSIDATLRSFVRAQENLTRQIYREGLHRTVLLTRILEEEQRRTLLMEALVKRNK